MKCPPSKKEMNDMKRSMPVDRMDTKKRVPPKGQTMPAKPMSKMPK